MAKDSLGRDILPGQVIVYAQRSNTRAYVTVGVVRKVDNMYVYGEQVQEVYAYDERRWETHYRPFKWGMFDRMTSIGITEEELCTLKEVANRG